MAQRRSRLRAPDADRRERVISTSGLVGVALGIVVVLVLLFPRNSLVEQLRAGKGVDALSVSYLANLLRSEPDNLDLRLSLVERHLLLRQVDLAEQTLAPVAIEAQSREPLQMRARRLRIDLRLRQLSAAPDAPGAPALREWLLAALQAELDQPWPPAQLHQFALQAAELDQPQLSLAFEAHAHPAPPLVARRPAAPGAASAPALTTASGGPVDGGSVGTPPEPPPSFDESVRRAVAARDLTGAAQLHVDALTISGSPAARRAHLMAALRLLQSANRLDDALALARRHDAVVGNDPQLLRYLVELALAADRASQADPYAKRLLRMSRAASDAATGPVGWLTRALDALVPAAHAAPPGVTPRIAAGRALPPFAPGQPELAYDEPVYRLAFQTFLANRNLDDAWRVAAAAVRQVPESAEWRERLAQVCEWRERPGDALPQWQWLAEHAADPALAARALAAVLRIAAALGDDQALLETWQLIARQRALTRAEALALADLHERLGQPRDALAWLATRDATEPDAVWLERQVDILERLEDAPGAIAALEALIARDGRTPARARRLAGFWLALDDPERAHAALQPLTVPLDANGAPPALDPATWRLIADLAWALQREDEAVQALRQLGGLARPDNTGNTDGTGNIGNTDGPTRFERADDADRLIALLRERDPAEAARVAEAVWRQLGRPEHLAVAIELLWERRDLAALDRLFGRLTAADEARVGGPGSDFWRQRALWRGARGDTDGALADLRRAIAARPGDAELRAALIWQLIDANRRDELARLVDQTLAAGDPDPALHGALGAALSVLGQPARALPFWRREAATHRDDVLWLFAYADLLDAAGRPESAWAVQRQALRLIRARWADRAAWAAQPPALAHAQLLALARLTVERAPGDPSLAVLRQLLRRTPPDGGTPAVDATPDATPDAAQAAAVDELVLGWLLSTEQHEGARAWLVQRHARRLAVPVNAQLMLALHERDTEALQRLLTLPESELPAVSRIDALAALGRRAEAHELRVAELDRRERAEEVHTERAAADAATLHADIATEAWDRGHVAELGWTHRRSGLVVDTTTLTLRGPLDAATRWQVDAERSQLASANPAAITGVPPSADGLRLQLDHALDADTELGAMLLRHGAWASSVGLRLNARARAVAGLTVSGAMAWREPADESDALALAGARARVELAADWLVAPTLQARLAWQAVQLRLQDGPQLGRGQGLDLTVTQWLRLAVPDLSVSASIGRRQYSPARGVLPADTARLDPAGNRPTVDFFVPASHTLLGIGLASGLALTEPAARAWRPFGEWRLTHHSRDGTGQAVRLGLAGSVLGGDHLVLAFGRGFGATAAGPAGGVGSVNEHTASLRYALRF